MIRGRQVATASPYGSFIRYSPPVTTGVFFDASLPVNVSRRSDPTDLLTSDGALTPLT